MLVVRCALGDGSGATCGASGQRVTRGYFAEGVGLGVLPPLSVCKIFLGDVVDRCATLWYNVR